MTKEEINNIGFNPHDDKVYGVFDNQVHVRVLILKGKEGNIEEHAILIIPIEEYQRTWLNYLKGKQSICKAYGHYCGVWGGVYAEEAKEAGNIILLDFNPDNDPQDEQTWFQIEVPAKKYIVTKFSDYADFEHG
jgi:hypothetical protein